MSGFCTGASPEAQAILSGYTGALCDVKDILKCEGCRAMQRFILPESQAQTRHILSHMHQFIVDCFDTGFPIYSWWAHVHL